MPAIADLKRHAAAFLPLAVGRGSHDLPVDRHHRGEADEILLVAQVGDQVARVARASRGCSRRTDDSRDRNHAVRQEHRDDEHERTGQ